MALSCCSNRFAFRLMAVLLLSGCATAPVPEPQPEEPDGASEVEQLIPDPESAVAIATVGTEELTEEQYGRFMRAAVALQSGSAELAAGMFGELIEEVPDLAAAHANLGTALMMLEDDDNARQAFERAVALEPSLSATQVQLGVLYRRAGEFEKAEAAYNEALAYDPDNRYAHLNVGILYDLYLQKPQLALKHYQRFQDLSGEPDEEVSLWIEDLKQRISRRHL